MSAYQATISKELDCDISRHNILSMSIHPSINVSLLLTSIRPLSGDLAQQRVQRDRQHLPQLPRSRSPAIPGQGHGFESGRHQGRL